jgi:hypothetical protein
VEDAGPLDIRRALDITKDVAKGMTFLHALQPPIIHRDFKSANLLLDSDWTAKVCIYIYIYIRKGRKDGKEARQGKARKGKEGWKGRKERTERKARKSRKGRKGKERKLK